MRKTAPHRLFSTAPDIASLMTQLMWRGNHKKSTLLKPSTMRLFTTEYNNTQSSRAFGELHLKLGLLKNCTKLLQYLNQAGTLMTLLLLTGSKTLFNRNFVSVFEKIIFFEKRLESDMWRIDANNCFYARRIHWNHGLCRLECL